MLSRRAFGALAASSLLAPAGLLSAAPSSDRKFLFVVAVGGWDPTWVFAPMFGYSGIDIDSTATTSELQGISFVDSLDRPHVREFFQTYGSKSCVVNGLEVRSITHDICSRLVMTGMTQSRADDWPAILAGEAQGYTLPCLVISGPSYTSRYTSSVMRSGESGQLSSLLDGSALEDSDLHVRPLGGPGHTLVDQFLAQRSAERLAVAEAGSALRYAQDFSLSREQLELVSAMSDSLDLGAVDQSGYVDVAQRVEAALTCFELGVTRCAVVEHDGLWGVGWDTHAGIDAQSSHFEVLFTDLLAIFDDMASRTGTSGGSLLDEVTVVVLSEMGRTPKKNALGGKDHWTFTSALLYGNGIAGGQVVGGYDENFLGSPTVLSSGETSESGIVLSASNLGATLLALGDVDPGEYLGDVDVIQAVID